MSLPAAAEKKTSLSKARSRCDSPAPRTGPIAAIPSERSCKEVLEPPTAPPMLPGPLSCAIFSIALLLAGRMDFFNEPPEPFSDVSTWVALVIFIVIGVIVMRFDVLDIAKEEAKKKASQSSDSKQLADNPHAAAGWPLLIVTSLAVLLLGVAWARLTKVASGQLPQDFQSHPATEWEPLGSNWKPIFSQMEAKWNEFELHMQLDSVNSSQLAFTLTEDFYVRAAKFKGDAQHAENIYGRYFDASLVRGTDFSARISEAARRCAQKEAAAMLAKKPIKPCQQKTTHRWNTLTQWANETVIYFLSVALAIGLATSRSDIREMSQEEDASSGAEVHSYSTEKCLKPSQSTYQWRIYACGALLLATAVAMVASVMEEM